MSFVATSSKISSVSWLTLFYDLIVVAVVARATYIYGKTPTWYTFAFIFICLTIVYVLWAITSLELLANPRESWTKRGIILVQVTALLISGLAMYRNGGISDRWGFISLSVSFASVAALAYIRRFTPSADQRFRRPLMIISLVAAIIYGIGACFPMGFSIGSFLIAWLFYPLGTLWAIIALAIYGPRMVVSPSRIVAHALNERFGVLLLIVLGDSFLQTLEVLGTERSIPSPAFIVMLLIFVVTIWLQYYPNLSDPALARTAWAARVRIMSHFLVITSTAVSIVALVRLASVYDSVNPQTSDGTVFTAWPLVGVMVGILGLQLVQDNRWARFATTHLVAIVVLVGLTTSGVLMSNSVREIDLIAGIVVILADALVILGLAGKLRPHAPEVPPGDE